MSQREGYKKTKIGWIPEDWEVKAIGTFSKSSSKKNTALNVDNVVSVTKYDGIVDSLSYFKKQVYSKNIETYKVIKKDDFAYATIHLDEGSIGILSHCETAVLSPMYTVFSIDQNIVDKDFFMGLVKSERMMNIYQHIGAGSINRRKSIPFSTFSKIQVPFPPLLEQKKIASILTTVDDKISSIEHQIQQTEQLKKGLMEKLLTEGIGHTEFKDTKIGRIPKGWDVKTIDDILKDKHSLTYGILQPGDNDTNGIPMLRTVDISKNGTLNDTEILRVSGSIEREYERTRLKGNEVLLSVMGTVGRSIIVKKEWTGWNVNRALAVIRLNDMVNKEFFYFWLQSPQTQRFFENTIIGSAQKRINLKDFRRVSIPIPDNEEQQKLVSIFNSIFSKLAILSEKKAQYQNLKKGLSQQLLTGQMRVKA